MGDDVGFEVDVQDLQVAQKVEDLVTHQLGREAEVVLVQDLIVTDDDRIAQVAAANQPRRLELLDLVEEPESAGWGDFPFEDLGSDLERFELMSHERMVEVDGERYLQPIRGQESDLHVPLLV